jgi:hypothetical protein
MPVRSVNPLHSAVSKGSVEDVLAVLADASGAIDAIDATNSSALSIAIQRGFTPIGILRFSYFSYNFSQSRCY